MPSDRTAARLRPRSLEELSLAYGIAARKAEHYGDGLLRVIRESVPTPVVAP